MLTLVRTQWSPTKSECCHLICLLHSFCASVQAEFIWGKCFQTSYRNLDKSSWNVAMNVLHRAPFHSLDYFGILLVGSFLNKSQKDWNICKLLQGLVTKPENIALRRKHLSELTSGLLTLTSPRQAVETYEMSYCLCQIGNTSYLLSACSSIGKVAIRCLLRVGGGSVNWLLLHWNAFTYDLFWVLLIFCEWAMCSCKWGNLLTDWLTK